MEHSPLPRLPNTAFAYYSNLLFIFFFFFSFRTPLFVSRGTDLITAIAFGAVMKLQFIVFSILLFLHLPQGPVS